MPERDETTVDIRSFGAERGIVNTKAIQQALDDRAGTGGTVSVPPGEYVTGPLKVGAETTLRIENGATLRFVEDYDAFPTAESRWEGWDQVGFHPCLWIRDAENVEITGKGTIDGSGEYWWKFYEGDYPEGLADRLAEFAERNEFEDDVSSFTLRPPLLQIYDAENVTVSGVTLRNSPFWNTHVVYSADVTVHDVTIENPADAPNGDGIDVDSSRFVRISDTYINAGDDAICLKSGKDEPGREVGEPARNITVTNCTIEAGHGGVVIGSEMSGDVRDVTVSNCTFTETDRGIRIKTQRGRGGVVEDLHFENIVMRTVVCPFVINGYYFTPLDSDPEPIDESTPMVRNVHFSNITARDVESAAFLAGLPERRLEGITFSNVRIDATRSLDATDLNPAMADGYEQVHGLFCKSIADVSFADVTVRTPDAPAMRFEDTDRVSVENLSVESGSLPPIELEDVGATRIRNCVLPDDGPFLRADGEETRTISLRGNHGSPAIDADGASNLEVDRQ